MMDNGLAIFMDIAVVLYMYMQHSLQDLESGSVPADTSGVFSTPGRITPATARRNKRAENERRRLESDLITSSESTAETGGSW